MQNNRSLSTRQKKIAYLDSAIIKDRRTDDEVKSHVQRACIYYVTLGTQEV